MLSFLPEFSLWLAPMESVTDRVFRLICKRMGADVLVSEFVSSEALIRERLTSLSKMALDVCERPVGIQIFGHDENSMRVAAEIAAREKPDFIDINWGCPVNKIVKKGAGSAILQDIPKMVRITAAVVRAVESVGCNTGEVMNGGSTVGVKGAVGAKCTVGDSDVDSRCSGSAGNTSSIPVTVKTRLGWDSSSKPIVEVAERLQDIGISGISIHGRTRAQLYSGEADWTLIGEVKNNPRMHIPVFGNGDIDTAEKALLMRDRYGVDGVLIGRGAIGNPWIFAQTKALMLQKWHLPQEAAIQTPTVEERINVLLQHLHDEIEMRTAEPLTFELTPEERYARAERISCNEIKIHYSGYFKGIQGFKPFKVRLMKSSTLQEVKDILQEVKRVIPYS
ncbi:MAG: tRNA-dihydrouridine synthase family protein [Bacteroidales bacterium]|jgi:tRNA-dihydrouridine synthase|nr:tRNA-dihydrouridine synthase family protein [Bacteroidales bacterium]